tara:strand:- start:1992 stop:2207 length:216 start_codon:yes stop_codon:yes gene_type:complete
MNNSSQILIELDELRKMWRVQDFNYTQAQQARYEELMGLRKAFIEHWKEEGRVWVGPSNAGSNFDKEEGEE